MSWTLAELWALACKHDGIEPDAALATCQFVVFSDGNPWLKKYNFGLRCARLARQQRGGTVGTLENL
jgi:hypothetical protein